MALHGQGYVQISAPPGAVYAVISDVTRTPEWSPECYRCEWFPGPVQGPVAGARFKGHNQRSWMRWSTICTVTAAEPGQAFAFQTEVPWRRQKGTQTRWTYTLQPAGGGTLLTESFEVLWTTWIVALSFGGRRRRLAQLERGVRESLASIKAIVESGMST